MEQAKSEALTVHKSFSLTPKSLTEAMEYAKLIANSEVCPKALQGKTGDVLIAVQMGAEVGLSPMQAIQNIAVINGRPTVWGDALLGIAQAHPAFEGIEETIDEKTMTATCSIKRRGMAPTIRTFSMADAKTAGLSGKAGPWTNYPKRMLQMRARGFAVRDSFADAIKGLAMREEVEDYQAVATTPEGHKIEMPKRKSEALAPEAPKPAPDPTPKAETPAPSAPAGGDELYITSEQLTALCIFQKENKVEDEDLKAWLGAAYPGCDSRKKIKAKNLTFVRNWIASQGAAAQHGDAHEAPPADERKDF